MSVRNRAIVATSLIIRVRKENMIPGEARTAAALYRMFRKGAWTNNPEDSNYPSHWNSHPAAPDDDVTNVYPGTAQVGRTRTPVNVRVANDPSGQTVYYVDTPSIERVGPVASLAGRVLDRTGASTPRRLESEAITVRRVAPNKVQLAAPDVQVTARTDGFVGRPSQLSAKDQLRNAWRLARG